MLARSVSEQHDAVGLDGAFDQLTETGDAKARGDVVGVFTVAPALVGVDDSPALSGGNTHHQIEVVPLGELRPFAGDVAIVLGRNRESRGGVDAVMIKEHAIDLVSPLEHGAAEIERRIGGLVLIGPLTDDDGEFHPGDSFLFLRASFQVRGLRSEHDNVNDPGP